LIPLCPSLHTFPLSLSNMMQRQFMNISDAETLVHAFITSWLDYWKSLFCGLPNSSIYAIYSSHIQRNLPTLLRFYADFIGNRYAFVLNTRYSLSYSKHSMVSIGLQPTQMSFSRTLSRSFSRFSETPRILHFFWK